MVKVIQPPGIVREKIRLFKVLLVLVATALFSSYLVPLVFGQDHFSINIAGLKEDDKAFEFPNKAYSIPLNYNLNLSTSKSVCPSGHCNVTYDSNAGQGLVVVIKNDSLVIDGDFKLNDVSNSHFTPKKRSLVENMYSLFSCNFSDIQEDMKTGKTKYLCSEGSGAFERLFNFTQYPYDIVASFEIPSGHLLMNATHSDTPDLMFYGNHVLTPK